jgi:hypothetical protein
MTPSVATVVGRCGVCTYGVEMDSSGSCCSPGIVEEVLERFIRLKEFNKQTKSFDTVGIDTVASIMAKPQIAEVGRPVISGRALRNYIGLLRQSV